MSYADELVARYVLRQYKEKKPREHLATCAEVAVEHLDAEDGFYGCETGCEYLRLEATLRCPHGQSEDFHYGEFGLIADILEDMAKDNPPSPPEGTVQLAHTTDGRQIVMNAAGEVSVVTLLKPGCCEDEACYGACECEEHECEYSGPKADTP